MSDNREWNKIGEDISNSVQDAIKKGDFSQINQLVGDIVNSALGEAGKGVQQAFGPGGYYENEIKRQQEWMARKDAERAERERQRAQRDAARAMREQMRNSGAGGAGGYGGGQPGQPGMTYSWGGRRSLWDRIRAKRVGNTSGLFMKMIGIWGMIPFTIGTIATFMEYVDGYGDLSEVFIVAAFEVFFISLFKGGNKRRKRVKRAERYVNLCGEKQYASIADLASMTGNTKEFVTKDLKEMLELGMFPQGHFDTKSKVFYLSEAAYSGQYTAPEPEPVMQEAPAQPVDTRTKEEIELDALMTEGEETLTHLHELNERIPDETITEQLERMDGLLHEIFGRVKEHPEQMPRLQKVMNYYLPTTVKLVEAYADFDKVSVQGQDIVEAKREIEKTLCMINDSYGELLNNLFQDAAFDVTTDAQVLQSMLSREGLAKDSAFAPAEEEKPIELTL